MDWKKEIGIAFLVRQKLSEVDETLPLHLPKLAASVSALSNAESCLGRSLDQEHSAFLQATDGWDAFYQEVDMFSTQDFCGSERMARARELMATLEPLEPHCGVPSSELLPVAMSSTDIDVFLLGPPVQGNGGKVFWWAGQLIEIFPSFTEFFLSMVDLNRNEIKQLSEGAN